MNLLIDTHTLLWAICASKNLSEKAHAVLCDGGNSVFVSAVSLWEIALKYSLGKLELENFNVNDIPAYCEQMNFTLVPLDALDALASYHLPHKKEHKDPFDRMLIYQSIKRKWKFVTRDSATAASDICAESGMFKVRFIQTPYKQLQLS